MADPCAVRSASMQGCAPVVQSEPSSPLSVMSLEGALWLGSSASVSCPGVLSSISFDAVLYGLKEVLLTLPTREDLQTLLEDFGAACPGTRSAAVGEWEPDRPRSESLALGTCAHPGIPTPLVPPLTQQSTPLLPESAVLYGETSSQPSTSPASVLLGLLGHQTPAGFPALPIAHVSSMPQGVLVPVPEVTVSGGASPREPAALHGERSSDVHTLLIAALLVSAEALPKFADRPLDVSSSFSQTEDTDSPLSQVSALRFLYKHRPLPSFLSMPGTAFRPQDFPAFISLKLRDAGAIHRWGCPPLHLSDLIDYGLSPPRDPGCAAPSSHLSSSLSAEARGTWPSLLKLREARAIHRWGCFPLYILAPALFSLLTPVGLDCFAISLFLTYSVVIRLGI